MLCGGIIFFSTASFRSFAYAIDVSFAAVYILVNSFFTSDNYPITYGSLQTTSEGSLQTTSEGSCTLRSLWKSSWQGSLKLEEAPQPSLFVEPFLALGNSVTKQSIVKVLVSSVNAFRLKTLYRGFFLQIEKKRIDG